MTRKNEPLSAVDQNRITRDKAAKRRDIEILLEYFETQQEGIRLKQRDSVTREQDLDEWNQRTQQLMDFSEAERNNSGKS